MTYSYPVDAVPLFIRDLNGEHTYVGHFTPKGAKDFLKSLEAGKFYIDGLSQEDDTILTLQFFSYDDAAGYEISVDTV